MSGSHRYVYLLSFGSNVGDRASNLQRGRFLLAERGAFLKESGWVETEPLPSETYDVSDHEFYLNGVAEYACDLSPRELYREICLVEDAVGHRRDRRWAPRELDIDILFAAISNQNAPGFISATSLHYSGKCGLRVPHSGFWERPFLLKMLTENIGVPESILRIHSSVFMGEK